MPTLYVENVPADLYAALRTRARARHSSIAVETIRILREHVPTAPDLQRRRRAVAALLRPQPQTPPGGTDIAGGGATKRFASAISLSASL